ILNGTTWHDMGQLNGEAYSTSVFNNELYVVGNGFSLQDYAWEIMINKWGGSAWVDQGFPATSGFGTSRLFIHRGELNLAESNYGWLRFDGADWHLISTIQPFAIDKIDYDHYYVGGFFEYALLNAYTQ